MKLNSYQKAAARNFTLEQATQWNATEEKTSYLCDEFSLTLDELDAQIGHGDGLNFQDWLEFRMEAKLSEEGISLIDHGNSVPVSEHFVPTTTTVLEGDNETGATRTFEMTASGLEIKPDGSMAKHFTTPSSLSDKPFVWHTVGRFSYKLATS